MQNEPQIELTVVMPCLNEADTLGLCIEKAREGIAAAKLEGEIVVADNGSTDRSREIAEQLGVRVVQVMQQGYGAALRAGIDAARGRLIIMGDADDSYDFRRLPLFTEKLREGFNLVQGCRLPSGGGRVMPGAMPLLHRWFGNPLFSILVRRMFRSSVHDVNCGMRGFTRELYDALDLRCTGMEFATEMIIKASLRGQNIAEVPIVLHPDGRRSHKPHLRTFRDGWRTLRFFLMCSPRWLFLFPGAALILLGLLGYALVMPGLEIAGVTPEAHTLLVASLAILMGYQSLLFSIHAKTFAISEGLLPPDPRLDRFFEVFTLEKSLLVSGDYTRTMRWVIPGVTLTALGFQTFLSSFFVSILGIRRS